ASTRSSLCAKPHDQHHGRPILQNLTHTTVVRFHIRSSQSDRTELDAARAKWCGSDMDQGEQATAAQ
ncbi:hypothetical protein NKH64_30090, partial [Mesorhizobium sp. M0999]